MVAAAALLGVFRLARALFGTPTAATVTFLTAVYPVWFAQSTLAHADLFAAAFSLWALSFYFERYTPTDLPLANRLARSSPPVLFSLAALSKETAIVTPVALAALGITLLLTESRTSLHRQPRWASPLAPSPPPRPLVPLSLPATGFAFGNPEFLRYNATANLSPDPSPPQPVASRRAPYRAHESLRLPSCHPGYPA